MKQAHSIISGAPTRYAARGRDLAALLLSLALMLATLGGCRDSARRDAHQPQSPIATTQLTTAPVADGQVATAPVATRFDVRAAVEYLTSDELEGRGVDTDGLDRAADYIAETFRSMGLVPLPGQETYFQSFEYVVSAGIAPGTALRCDDRTFALHRDYTVASFSAEKAFEGPAVFAGYGITSEEHDYDDYADIHARGKVVIAFRYEPHDSRGRSQFDPRGWSDHATLGRKARTADDHGAVALLLVNPPQFHPGDILMPFAQRFSGDRASIPVIQITQSVANELLKRGQVKDLAALQKAIDEAGRPASAELDGVSVSGQTTLERKARTLRNVMAMLPGDGPNADEYILVGAHYDHLGYGAFGSLGPGGRTIHPGADDNASGTVGMLRIADLLTRDEDALEHDAPPDGRYNRSIIFVAFTAEERGLVGSSHFVNHPPVPLGKIAAMLNFDMIGRVRNDVVYVVGTDTADGFDTLVSRADALSPLSLRSDGPGGIGGSDHFLFMMSNVPILFFWTGLHPEYHRPSDTADKINYDGLEQIARVGAWTVRQLSDADKPAFAYTVRDSYPTTAPGDGIVVQAPRRARLGVMPDYTAEWTAGVKIAAIMPDTPAATANLRAGDIIIGWEDQTVDTIDNLTDLLARANPGDTVRLRIKRGDEVIEAQVKLGERKQ